MTEPDTLNPPATGDETEAPDAPRDRARRRAGRSNGAPATTYAYNVYLDGEGVRVVGEWEAVNAETTMFCDQSDEENEDGSHDRYPRCLDGDDLIWVARVDAATNDKAVAMVLQGDDGEERGKIVRGAHLAFVDLEPIAIPVSRVETGRVPCPWRVERSCAIGGGR